jgi:predicted TIM-barrel fold metal-dependent hydrolase
VEEGKSVAVTQHFQQLISADSHIYEPGDLWWKALGQRFGDRTPRALDTYQGQPGKFFYSGYQGCPVMRLREQNSPQTEAAAVEAAEKGFGACGYDPTVRVKFQAEAGLAAEVLNPTSMLSILRNPDAEVVQACAAVFNDWEAAFVSHDRRRLIGVSVIPLYDVDWAVSELERTLGNSLLTPMIPCQAPSGCPPYRDPVYDRFWAAASAAGAPVTLHILTGRVLDPLILARTLQSPTEGQENAGLWLELSNEIQLVLANDFIFGGILDRFPTLKIVCSEFEMSWVPGFMARLDQIDVIAPRLHLPRLARRASDYMRTHIWHGFIDDTATVYSIPYVGAGQVLWGSDFPHTRSIGLEAQSTLCKQLATLPRQDQEKVVGGNAVQVFNLN